MTQSSSFRSRAMAFGLVALGFLVLNAPAWAQQGSGIAGVVRDTSGLAMPGVTVEAASPALIEKVRTVTTDGEGRYSVVDLRPGTYTVTFSLTGFSTVKRDGITLGTGFTATVNIAMQVGSLEETITVSGAAPVVDTTSMRKQETLNSSELESLPSGNVGLQTLAYVTPGFAATQADVGGTRDTWSAQGNYTLFHGKTGTRANFDGFRNQYFVNEASGVGYITDQGNIQELQIETSGMGAEAGSGSVSLNAIPKSGSNTFAGGLDGYFSNGSMKGANVRDNLNAWTLGNAALFNSAGIKSAAEVERIYRLGVQFGGPIKQDKVWFYTAVARGGSTVNQPSAFYNPLQGKAQVYNPSFGLANAANNIGVTPTLFYPGQPGSPFANVSYTDPSLYSGADPRKAASFDWYRNHAGRITAQLNSKNRFNIYGDVQKSCRCTTGPFTGANSIESERGWDWFPSGVIQGTWTAPLTSRLLLEAGGSWQDANWVNFAEDGVTQNDRSIIELSTGYRYGATSLLTAPKARTGRGAQRFTMSYVTGTHNLKIGATNEQGFNDESRSRNNVVDGLNYDFTNGKPTALQYYATPFTVNVRQNMELGVFAQDQWKLGRMTLNLGARYDRVTYGYLASVAEAGAYVPRREAPALNGVPIYNDFSPRVGAVYDLMGNGRTALRFSTGRYVGLSRGDFTSRFHPFNSSINSASRVWNDANGNYIPDCDVKNLQANGECGKISSDFFGTFNPAVPAVLFDDSAKFKNRDFLWDINVDIQHEIVHGLSVNAGYNHNWDGSFTVTDNIALSPSDFDEYCITVPNDSRLGTGATQRCGFYDVTPSKFGQGQIRVTNAQEFADKNGNSGLPKRYWDGLWLSVDGRIHGDIRVGGGIDSGRQVANGCFTVDVPNTPTDITNTTGAATAFYGNTLNGEGSCKVVTSWANNTDFRFNASVPVKGGFNASFIYRNTRGAAQNATLAVSVPTAASNPYQVTFKNGRAATSLTRAGSLNLITPNSLFGPRFNQLDVAVNKTLDTAIGKVRLAFDVYNALNSNSIQNVTTAYGSRWQRPTTFLDPRLARVTASFSF